MHDALGTNETRGAAARNEKVKVPELNSQDWNNQRRRAVQPHLDSQSRRLLFFNVLLVFSGVRYSGVCCDILSLQRKKKKKSLGLVARPKKILIMFTNRDVIAAVWQAVDCVSFLCTGDGGRVVESLAALHSR